MRKMLATNVGCAVVDFDGEALTAHLQKIAGKDFNDALCKSGIFTNAFEYRCSAIGNLEKVGNKSFDSRLE